MSQETHNIGDGEISMPADPVENTSSDLVPGNSNPGDGEETTGEMRQERVVVSGLL